MNHRQAKKGFTLVEIMIVVVIIGLLATMAIPAFNRIRRSSIEKTVINDGRQIGSAAQQWFMDNGVDSVAAEDIIGEGKAITALSTGVVLETDPITVADGFVLSHPSLVTDDNADGSITFDSEGKKVAAAAAAEAPEAPVEP